MDSNKSGQSALPVPSPRGSPAALWQRCVDLFTRSKLGRHPEPEPDLQPAGSSTLPIADWRRPALIGYIVIIFAFGVLGTWSAFAKLASAVLAPGTVTLESSRKVIQHFEGGIVAKILVHEGEHVDQGQLLFMLDDTAARANASAVQDELFALRAQEARLIAERDGRDTVDYPDDFATKMAERVVRDAVADENKQFLERRASLSGEVDILNSKINAFHTQIQGITDERNATEQQLAYINSELTDLTGLLEKNLVQKTRFLALQREKARLEGVIGQAVADIAKTQNDIGEANLQIVQLHKKFSEDVNSQILQVREKIAELREKNIVSTDVLQRIQIRAPLSGTVQNLHVATVGGVIRSGEPLAELVPDNDNLIVDAQVAPADIDAIDQGMQAEVRFSAFHGYTLPIILGHVDTLSRDSITNEGTKQPYFLARIVVDRKDVPSIIQGKIRAGMPVQVIVPTGERTVISYLTRPLRNRANSAFREK